MRFIQKRLRKRAGNSGVHRVLRRWRGTSWRDAVGGSVLLGAASGLRGQIGVAVIAVRSDPSLPPILRERWSRRVLVAAAVGELVATSCRAPQGSSSCGIVGRLVLGALSRAFAQTRQAPWLPASGIGAASAIVAAKIGHDLRAHWVKQVPDPSAAVVEDTAASARPVGSRALIGYQRCASCRRGPAASLPGLDSTNQFKNGTHIDVDGTVFRIVEFQHVKPGKGGAFVRSKLKRVDDGAVIDKTFKAGEKFRPVRTETRKMQFLYDSGEAAVFMDNQSYDQVEIPKSVVEDALRWVPANSDVDPLFVDERPAGAQPPTAVELTVTQTDPGLKGDTASGGGTKPATLETGVVVQVPLFIEEGERVRVDTRSGEYVSRA
jgi:elongation factor P